jgi:hypothetical protein
MLLPAIYPIEIPVSSKTFKTPISAAAFAPPPPNAMPIWGGGDSFKDFSSEKSTGGFFPF